MTQPATNPPTPKHTHYVSLDNGCIYPAMSSPAGYEDDHPSEYRPANASEIQRYINGATEVVDAPLDLMALDTAGSAASPTSIRLADDDPPQPFTVAPVPPEALAVQPVPVAPPAPPVQAVPIAPPVPAPMIAPAPAVAPAPYGE